MGDMPVWRGNCRPLHQILCSIEPMASAGSYPLSFQSCIAGATAAQSADNQTAGLSLAVAQRGGGRVRTSGHAIHPRLGLLFRNVVLARSSKGILVAGGRAYFKRRLNSSESGRIALHAD